MYGSKWGNFMLFVFIQVIFRYLTAMNGNLGNQSGMQRPPPNPFGNAFYGTGSGLIRGGLGAYGEKFLGSSSEFMQSNVC